MLPEMPAVRCRVSPAQRCGASSTWSFKSHLLLNCDLSKTSLFDTVREP